MTEVASREQVEEFLTKVAECVEKGQFLRVDRPKNLQTCADLDISPAEQIEHIIRLTCSNYYRGPKPDRSSPYRTVYEFGKMIHDREIYIKLVVGERSGLMNARCISFHTPEQPIDYPLRESED